MPETTKEAPAKDSPFFIKNLLNCESKPPGKPKPPSPSPALVAHRSALEAAGGFSLSQVADFGFPRFELPAQRFTLPAHYLERTSAWWYPYALNSTAHIHRSEGKTQGWMDGWIDRRCVIGNIIHINSSVCFCSCTATIAKENTKVLATNILFFLLYILATSDSGNRKKFK